MCMNEPQIIWIDPDVKVIELELPVLNIDRPKGDAELLLEKLDRHVQAVAKELGLKDPETWSAEDVLNELLKRLGGSYAIAYALKRQMRFHSQTRNQTLTGQCACEWCREATQALAQFGFPI